ncbi:transposase [Pseudoalteromonas prydzensis]|uniref:Transposase n=1 Tax=Pseudoalteromonas prydzensis TaxID=182141 RepID=A0ABR9FS56_9GAMM|nr:transposase [Pseudoalteromonas prydzensis]
MALHLIGKLYGINYVINQLEELRRYLEDVRRSIDNNHAESAIKPFVIGRKN